MILIKENTNLADLTHNQPPDWNVNKTHGKGSRLQELSWALEKVSRLQSLDGPYMYKNILMAMIFTCIVTGTLFLLGTGQLWK